MRNLFLLDSCRLWKGIHRGAVFFYVLLTIHLYISQELRPIELLFVGVGWDNIQAEDDGLSSSSFPFIVAEEDVCTEICTLQSALEFTEICSNSGETTELEGRSNAMEFIHEIGWLFHRNHLKSRLGNLDPNENLFSLSRFKWLVEFSMDHDWCAVVKKLLDVLLDGTVDFGDHPSLNFALTEMSLLHRAVRKNSRSLVELLLGYPSKVKDSSSSDGSTSSFLFRPDVVGPAGLTPLHIAAGKDDSMDVLDALTNDPGMVMFITVCFLIH